MRVIESEPLQLCPKLAELKEFNANAVYVCQRLRWSTQMPWTVLANKPLVLSVTGSGCAVIFRHGVIVTFNLDAEQREIFIHEIRGLMHAPFSRHEQEQVSIRLSNQNAEGADYESLIINDVTLPRLQIIADVLAKSTIMAYYENRVAEQFDRIEPVAEQLQLGKRGGHHSRELLRHIGDTLMMESRMIGRAEVMDKPDILWEYPELDRLYTRLEDEYELSERYEGLERKLGLISRTAETQLGLLHTNSSLRVEWYIVVLIVIDIIVSLFVK